MRPPIDTARLMRFLEELGKRSRSDGTLYLTGGATALLHGWRSSTVDVDIKLDPEPQGAFEAIARLKNELDVNVELASPDLFLPELADWRENSPVVGRFGRVEVHHYDLRAQALSKIARGHERDRLDVEAMLARGLVTRRALREAFESMRPRLLRYPRIDAERLADRVLRWTSGEGEAP